MLGAMKARLSGRRLFAGGLEVMLAGGGVGVLGYLLGRLVSTIFGIHI
jgi:VIT1/CCC1 family predicted Fe2+/Mn2+ transporter